MFWQKTALMVRTLLFMLSLGFVLQIALTDDAQARAGGRRSFGQRSSPYGAPRGPSPQQQPRYNQQQYQQPQSAPNRGGFMRGLAGGLAGGFLGSMLFSSLGHASGLGGAGSGGVGMLEIILLAGLAYLAFRLWKSRQNRPSALISPEGIGMTPSSWRDTPAVGSNNREAGYFAPLANQSRVETPAISIDRETAEDIFFRIQGAYTRRDLATVSEYLEKDVAKVLEQDINDLKSQKLINRLENISVRGVEVSDTWAEGDRDLVRVRFTANLLDYTVDENSGDIKDGSSSVPVRFEEDWIFAKARASNRWTLAGIEQI